MTQLPRKRQTAQGLVPAGSLAFDLVVVSLATGLVFWQCRQLSISADTCLASLVAVLLFVAVGSPWRCASSYLPANPCWLLISTICYAIGFASDLLLPTALAWTIAIWTVLRGRVEVESKPGLALLLVFVVPWLEVDFAQFSLPCQHLYAAITEVVLGCCGVDVLRSGELLTVSGQVVQVSDGCTGRDSLQLIIVVGLAALLTVQPSIRAGLLGLPFLFLLGGITNVARVLLIAVATLYLDKSLVKPIAHDLGGWLVVLLPTGLCLLYSSARWRKSHTRSDSREASPIVSTAVAPVLAPAVASDREIPRQVFAVRLTWIILGLCLLVDAAQPRLWHRRGSSRVYQLPLATSHAVGRNIPFTAAERAQLGEAEAIKRLYRVGQHWFHLHVVDGMNNRRAAHDPSYCWNTIDSRLMDLPGGTGRMATIMESDEPVQVLYWFTNGHEKHASAFRYVLDSSLHRVTGGQFGTSSCLVILRSTSTQPINWYRVINRLPELCTI